MKLRRPLVFTFLLLSLYFSDLVFDKFGITGFIKIIIFSLGFTPIVVLLEKHNIADKQIPRPLGFFLFILGFFVVYISQKLID